MVGFPGETESAFHSLLSVVKSFRFERLGCFTYSEQPETPASRLSSPVEDSIKMERYHRLMKIQEDIMSDFHRSLVGKTLEFILDDGPFSNKKPYFYGRTYGDAPDVDGRTKLTLRDKTISCHPGDILNGMVTKSDRYDLEGVFP
jgi:ribosomal protein S12 methylthiotransferase